MKEALSDRAELKLLRRALEQLVGDEQNDRLFEQTVVECAKELRSEQRNEAARTQQMCNVLDQSLGVQGFMDLGAAYPALTTPPNPITLDAGQCFRCQTF